MIGYTHSNYEGCMDDKKSTLGYTLSMSSTKTAWSTKKKHIFSLFVAEAKYKAVPITTCEVVWLRIIL
jgi:hypothetical protein